MNTWWKKLQDDSVAEWVLLTTFACWGIPNHFFQIAAFMLTGLFFAGKLSKLNHRYSFPKSESSIMEHISAANISPDENVRIISSLEKVKHFRKNRNLLFIFKRNWRFLAGYAFLTISFLYNLHPYFLR